MNRDTVCEKNWCAEKLLEEIEDDEPGLKIAE